MVGQKEVVCSGAPISTPVNHVVLVSPCPCEAKLCRQSDVSKHDVHTLSALQLSRARKLMLRPINSAAFMHCASIMQIFLP